MIITTSIFALPFLIILWFVDGLLFVMVVRLVVGIPSIARHTELGVHLRYLLNPILRPVERLLAVKGWLTNSPWLVWLVVMIGLYVIRVMMISLIMLMR